MSEAKANKAIKLEEELKLKEISKSIQTILEGEGYALQPFIQYTEYGLIPRVRLVKALKENTNDETTNTGEAGESQNKDADTPTEST